ncbi:MAG: histidine acid phosphatase [Bacteroidales bacterium]|nr:histidine acid phosphatase [Bacteroidales bacterium]
MRRILLPALFLFLTLTVQAQSPREAIKANPSLSAGCYRAYPDQNLPRLTPAPEGYEPFYISHYGRHGSRWLIDPEEYGFVIEQLQKAKRYNKLTTTGEETLEKLLRLQQAANGRLGELTELGAEQHRGIAERMYKNFPEVFKGNAAIDAKSTTIIRCILSMSNELQTLKALNPKLQISEDASQHDMYYLKHTQEPLKKYKQKAAAVNKEFRKKHTHHTRFIAQLINDASFAADSLDVPSTLYYFHGIAGNMQSHRMEDMSFFDLFTDEELYDLWQMDNVMWYVYQAAAPQTDSMCPFSQKPLLTNIIETADKAIREGVSQATLRFGHDTVIVPLAALMEVGNIGIRVDDLETLADRWQNYNIVPMGTNMQIIFYKQKGKRATPDDVLVKVLYNEHEMTLPVGEVQAPYYRWSTLRTYYLEKLSTYDE